MQKGGKKVKKTVLAIILSLIVIVAAGCDSYVFEPTGQYIVTAKDALALMNNGAIMVDVQAPEEYNSAHVEGAVNIPMSALVVNEPYSNMLPPAKQIEDVLGASGIKETDSILLYDDNANMQAARVQWTLNMYNNFNVKVVSGGLKALKEAGAKTSAENTVLPETAYTAGEKQESLLVSLEDIKAILNQPDKKTVIIDTRSDEEFAEGTIPGSVHIEYTWNNYPSGDYKIPMDIQSTYLEQDISPDMKLILFCKTSVRAAQTYAALKDAGYKDVRVYDGAWLEYSDVEKPQAPSGSPEPSKQDAS